MIFGLHYIDAAIIAVFMIAIVAVGFFVSHSIKKESDFYLGGRKLGRVLQFFLNFGNSTDSTGAVTVASSVYSTGASGIWVSGLQTLFITPFFWFTQPWYRRARLLTMGDLFVDRFDNKSLASAYAAFNTFMGLFTISMGNFFAYNVAHAMIVKPPELYTTAERQHVADYNEYSALSARVQNGTLARSDQRFQYLDDQIKRGDLESVVSYVTPFPFFLLYSAIVAAYIILGGLKAAAITDALQGLLILIMSVLLIPLGLRDVGGFHGLHLAVPAFKFAPWGDWVSVFAIFFASLVQIFGLLHNMSTAGSATNEDTARFGMISGGFTKRLVLVAWMLCGLLAIAVLAKSGGISNPDLAWGAMSKQLLVPGLMGLMLSGMLLGHMPSVGVSAVAVAGLTTRNLYEPLVPGKTESHYLAAGQWAVGIVLLASIMLSMIMTRYDVVSMYTMLVTFNTFFGAAVFLIFFWRRVTGRAIMIGLWIWVLVMGIAAWALPYSSAFTEIPGLLKMTDGYVDNVRSGATADDVAAGRATSVGESIVKPIHVGPTAVFFAKIAHSNPDDPNSPRQGLGRFNVENFMLSRVGVPVQKFTSSEMITARWLFDGLFPFVVIILLSLLGKPDHLDLADRLLVRLKTPVAPIPEDDRREVELSHADPHRFDHKRLFPGTNWYFGKWTKKDAIGFAGCWLIAGAILLVLKLVVTIGS